jgi:hypothetical protein
MTLIPVGLSVAFASPSTADCTQAGNATVCAQGTVRGGGPTPVSAGPVYPGYCSDPWYCSDDWGVDIVLDPGRPGIGGPGGPGRPGRPGGGGGIGPRR